jgi:hypothetical protein
VAALVRPVGGPHPRARRPARGDADEVEHRGCAALGDADFEDAHRAGVDRPDAVAALAVLAGATALAVFKPRGLTPPGRRPA